MIQFSIDYRSTQSPFRELLLGLLVLGIAAKSDHKQGDSEYIILDHTGDDKDEREAGRGNRTGTSRPDDSG